MALPFPPRGPMGPVPPTHRYYESAPTPCHPSPRASLPSPSDTAERLIVRSDSRPSAARYGPVETPAPPSGSLGGDDRVSQVPGKPQCVHAPLSDPGGTLVRCRFAPEYCLPLLRQRRLPRLERFRGSITRPTRSLCTLRRAGYPTTTQHSVPAVGTLSRAGMNTRWVPMRSFRDVLTSSQSPRLGLAHPR